MKIKLSQRVHWEVKAGVWGFGLSERVRQKGRGKPLPEAVRKAVRQACPLILVRIAANVHDFFEHAH